MHNWRMKISDGEHMTIQQNLTESQDRAFVGICAFMAEHSYGPTIAELEKSLEGKK